MTTKMDGFKKAKPLIICVLCFSKKKNMRIIMEDDARGFCLHAVRQNGSPVNSQA